MDTKNKLIFLSLLGFSMGLLIGAVITCVFADYAEYSNRMMMLAQLIGSGLLGMVSMGGTIVYDLEEWGLTQATFTHYILAFIAFFTASEVLGWFKHDVLLVVSIAFTVIYFIIWLINFLSWKAQIRQMNRELTAFKE